MALQRITRLTPLTEVLARIDALVQPVAPRRLAPAAGQVLAVDIVVDADIPAVPSALRDGWAVTADMLADAGSYAALQLPVVPPWVNVGDAMPAGADAVAMPDTVTVDGGRAEALAPVTQGDGVVARGGEARSGDILLRAGTALTAMHVSVLERLGIAEVSVRVPRPDEDYVISVGGTGSGRNDRAVRDLAAQGEVVCHGIAISPGETAAFGMIGVKPVLLLPGRLDAATAARLTIGRHLLARLSGATASDVGFSLPLSRKVASPLGIAEIVPVRVHDNTAEPLASGAWPLAAMARATGWVLVPAESEGYPAGSAVVIRPWS